MKVSAGFLPRRLVLLGAALALALVALVPAVALAAPRAQAVCDLACLQKFGDDQIAARLQSLSDLSTKIDGLVSKNQLTSDQATTLKSAIQDNVNNLTTLKQKIDGDTDVTTARADDKSIMTQYRIYAVFMPLLRHTVWVDLVTNALSTMSGLNDKITEAISKAPASQQTQLNALFKDYKAKLADAQTQLTNAAKLYASMTTDAYNKNPSGFKLSTLGALHRDSKTAHTDIKAARTDLHQIAMILRADQASATTTPTYTTPTSTTPTSTGTPAH